MKALVMIALLTTIGAATAVASGSSDDRHNGISGEAPPAGAFSIPGSDLLFSRADDFRWTLEDEHLNVQTTRNDRYRVEVITPNVLRLCWPQVTDRCDSARFLIRIGSPEYERMIAFRQCVDANRGSSSRSRSARRRSSCRRTDFARGAVGHDPAMLMPAAPFPLLPAALLGDLS